MEETKWLTKGKIISITILFITIIMIVSFSIVRKSVLKKEFIKFENTITLAAHNYITREGIELSKNEFREINIKDIIKKKIVFNTKHSDICDGYVIAETDSNDNTKYTTYIKCGKYYTTDNYGYKPSDKTKNTKETQTEKDTTKPEITLFGDKTITLTVGDKYEELGAAATDNIDGDLTKSIKITGKVDTTKAGTYEIKYTVSDKSNNTTTVSREVVVKEEEKQVEEPKEDVVTPTPTPTPAPTPTPSTPSRDTTKPIITFSNPSAYQTICVGSSVNTSSTGPYGYYAIDNVDGNITSKVSISGNTGIINSQGNYEIYYSVSDSSGNTAYATKTFTVKNCSVSVPDVKTSVPVSSVGLTPNSTTLNIGSTLQLTLTIRPSNATDKSVTYRSSNTSVASVSSSGLVRAISAGSANIYVRSSNGKEAVCTITVR